MPIITFEGIDRSGKSTQIKAVAEALSQEGLPVYVKKFPDYDSPFGKLILAYLKSEESYSPEELTLMFIADFARSAPHIKDFSEKGYVLVDRYYMSTMAYQGYKGVNFMHILSIIKDMGIPIADSTYLFNISPEQSYLRGREILDRHELDRDMIQGVSDGYKHLYRNLPFYKVKTLFKEVDATLDPETITNTIVKSIKQDFPLN